MTAKEFLTELTKIDKRINRKLELRQEYWEKATIANSCSVITPKRNRRKASPFENFVAKMTDLDREIKQEIDALVDRRQEAKRMIDAIPDHRYRSILEMRYFHGARWKRIIADMHYASASIFRLHGKALLAFDKMRVNNSDVLHIL